VPLKVAKKKICEVQADMEAMKAEHVEIIKELERNYKEMEKDMQEYFLDYIAKMKRAAEIREKQHVSEISKIRSGATDFTKLGEKSISEANNVIATLTENVATLESELNSVTQQRDRLQQQTSTGSQLCHSLIQDLRSHQDSSKEVGDAFSLMMQQCKELIQRLNEVNHSNSEMKSAMQGDHVYQLETNQTLTKSVQDVDDRSNAIKSCLERLDTECLEKLSTLNHVNEANKTLQMNVARLENEISTLTSNLSSTDQVLKKEISKLEKVLDELDIEYSDKFSKMDTDISSFEILMASIVENTGLKLGGLFSIVASLTSERDNFIVASSQSTAEISGAREQLEQLMLEKHSAEDEARRLSDENQAAREENLALAAKIGELQSDIERLTASSTDLSAETEKWQGEVNRLNERLSMVQVECDTQRTEVLHLKEIEEKLRGSEAQLKAESAAAIISSNEIISMLVLCIEDSASLGQEVNALVEEAALNATPRDNTQFVEQQACFHSPNAINRLLI
jgi:uncharacterized phage infection (PIP) family protein YhgE